MRRERMRGEWTPSALMGLIATAGLAAGLACIGGCDDAEPQPPETAGTTEGAATSRTLATNDRSGSLDQTAAGQSRVISEIPAGEWTLRLSRGPGGDQEVEVIKAGNTYWSRIGKGFEIEPDALLLESRGESFGQGDDLTGDGRPDLLIRERRPQNPAGDLFLLLTPGDPVELTARLDAVGEGVGFADLDGDRALEFITRDPALGESSPPVILSFQGGEFRPSPAHMAAEQPDRAELERRIEGVILDDSWERGAPPPALAEEAAALLYAGHENLAWQFLDWAWPEGVKGRDAFVEKFKADLEASPYYAHLGR